MAHMTRPNRNRLALFVGTLALAAVGLTVVSRITAISPIAFAPIYMFSPMVAGLAVCLIREIPLSDVGLRIGRGRWLVASAVAALPLVGVTLLLAVAVPEVRFDPAADPLPGVALPAGILGVAVTFGLVLALGTTVNAVFAFGEEFGWRGYLLWELAPLAFWKASLAIGALWGVWHAPVIVAGTTIRRFRRSGSSS